MQNFISPHIDHPLSGGSWKDGDMETINLQHISRLGFPITLQQGTATEEDLYTHAHLRQELSPGTIDKHLRYLRYMQNHPCPVNIQHPTLENFIHHLDYRREIENASPNALKHEYKAMQMLLRAYGLPPWNIKLPAAPKHSLRILPMPNTVHKFFNYKYSKDTYENKLYQYLYYHSFLIGWRTPSEPSNMKTTDILINPDDTGYITITETKKGQRRRTIMPEPEILNDYRRKSIKNWIDHWRPKVENQYSKDALYLWPSGKPITTRKIGQKLSKHGKQIWAHFRPYDMRHWCAIARLIQEKHEHNNYDTYIIKNWLGHEEISTTMQYIQHAEQYYRQAPYNWIKRVLKNHYTNMVEENPLNPVKGVTLHSIKQEKGVSSKIIPSRNAHGPAEAYKHQQKEKKSITPLEKQISESQPFSFFFSFLYSSYGENKIAILTAFSILNDTPRASPKTIHHHTMDETYQIMIPQCLLFPNIYVSSIPLIITVTLEDEDKKGDNQEDTPSLITHISRRFLALFDLSSSSHITVTNEIWDINGDTSAFFHLSKSAFIHLSSS